VLFCALCTTPRTVAQHLLTRLLERSTSRRRSPTLRGVSHFTTVVSSLLYESKTRHDNAGLSPQSRRQIHSVALYFVAKGLWVSVRDLNLLNGRSLVPNCHVHHHYHHHHHLESRLFRPSTLTCNQGNPTRCGSFCEVRLERCHTSRQTTEILACRIATTLDNAEVGQTDEMDARTTTYASCILVRRS